jgi:SET domain-containing protein
VLDPAEPLRYVNHCCDPNCEIFYWEGDETEPQEDRLWMQTIRPVEAGEEILIDYSWPADAAIPCRCGSASCRGWIVDPAERHLLPDPPPT